MSEQARQACTLSIPDHDLRWDGWMQDASQLQGYTAEGY